MGFKRFLFAVVVRLVLLMAALSATVYLIAAPGYHAGSLLLAGVSLGLLVKLFYYVSKTNAELVRFLDAARYADFGQRFQLTHLGAGFESLGDTFNAILERIRTERTDREAELRHLKAMIEHVPTPIMSLHADGTVTIWNNAARRLFAQTPVTRSSDLAHYGGSFQTQLMEAVPGKRALVEFVADGISRQLTIAATELIISNRVEKLISLQDIQTELDSAQIKA